MPTTSWPARRKSGTMTEPMYPVWPVTSTFTHNLPYDCTLNYDAGYASTSLRQ